MFANWFIVNKPNRACLVWLILIFVVFVAAQFISTENTYRTDGPVVAVSTDSIVKVAFGKDTVNVSLTKGEELKVLGFRRSSVRPTVLVQNAAGERFYLDQENLPPFEENARKEFQLDDTGACYGVATIGNFERKAVALDSVAMTAKFGEPELVYHTADGSALMQYRTKVFSTESGESYWPVAHLGSDGVVDSCTLDKFNNRNDWLLAHLPLASTIIDSGLTSCIVRGGLYESGANDSKFMAWVKLIVSVPFLLVWFFATGAILVLLIGWLTSFPLVFKPLNDSVLKIIIIIVGLIGFYWWAVVTLAWGMFAVFLLVAAWLTWRLVGMAIQDLCSVPHTRCLKCRSLYTMKFDREEITKTYIQSGRDVKQGRAVGSRKVKWQTYDMVTRTATKTNGYGRVVSSKTWTSKENVKNHERVDKIYEYIHYDVTYRVEEYVHIYVCGHCGYEEVVPGIRYIELDRKQTGQSVGGWE